jgi:diguanylate cyclase (GGDEF)-like protein
VNSPPGLLSLKAFRRRDDPTDDVGDSDVAQPEHDLEYASSRQALEILFATVQDLTSTLDTDEVIARLLKRVLLHLDSEIASIMLLGSDDTLHITHAQGLPESVIESTRVPLGEGIAGHVARTGIALLVTDVEHDARFKRENHERYYTHSALSAPLRNRGDVVGVINVNNKRSREPYSPDDRQLIEAIAGHATVALANASSFEETLRRAQTDALTGLANHGHFWTTLESEIARSERHERTMSLAMLDADYFKAFNDRYGHVAGDDALIGLARAIQVSSRVHDTPARYGGEEFAIILPETTAGGARIFAEKIRQAIEAKSLGPASAGALTVSVGVATYPDDAQDPAALVERADAHLYRAKDAGRNQVCSTD